MTHNDYTKLILNIKDNNIFFEDNCLEIVNINDIKTKVFHGYLTYISESYSKCNCPNKGCENIVKWN